MTSPVARVTAGLALTGAVLGGIAGALTFGIALAISLAPLLAVAAMIGGTIGFVATPVVGWLLLRRVPLGRAFRALVTGTVVGGLVGWLLPGYDYTMVQPVATAVVGFLTAALIARRMPSRRAPDDSVAIEQLR